MSTNKVVDTNGRVSITNLRNYDLYFKAIESDRNIKIPANAKGLRSLTYNEVASQIQSGNPMFVGTDYKGTNARIIIDDEDTRNQLFQVSGNEAKEINNYTLSLEVVQDLFKIKNIKNFKAEIALYVQNEGDKQALIDLSTKAGIDKATVAQKTAIEKITGYKFSTTAEQGEEE